MKNLGGIITWLFGMLLIISFTGIGSSSPSLSNSGGGNWQNYREITITENSGSTLADYQVLVQIPSNKFPTNVLSDGADIRFVDTNEKELNYWIESWDYYGKNARIWVKVPNIPSVGNTDIKMYYGNDKASSSSNGDNTFELFDDFSEVSLDTSKWLIEGTGYSIVDGELKLGGADAEIVDKTIDMANYIVEGKIRLIDINFPGFLYNRYSQGHYYDFYFGDVVGGEIFRHDGGLWMRTQEERNLWTPALNTQYTFKHTITGANVNFKFYSGSTLSFDHTKALIASYNHGSIGFLNYQSGGDARFDDVRVRKYISSEPTVSQGAEKSVATPTPEPTSPPSSPSPGDTIAPVPPAGGPRAEPKPLLSVSQDPFTFNFGTMKTGETASQVLSISNAGGETLTWGISDDQPWITANPTSGSNSGTVLININTVGLNPGSYSGTIIVTSNGGTKKGSVLLNIPDVSAAAPALTTAPSAAPVTLPVASPVSLSQIVGVILVLGGLLLTTLTTVKKDISLEVGVSEKTLKYVGGAGVLLVIIGAYMLLRTSGFM